MEEAIQQPTVLPPVLAILRSLPPDVLLDSFWGVLPHGSRTAFRQTCSAADAWFRQNLKTTTVSFNHHFLESLGSSGRSLAQHFPELRALAIRQASAGRKPLPLEVVHTCLELLLLAGGGNGDGAGGRLPPGAGGFRYVRELALCDWPSVGAADLGHLGAAFPGVEQLAISCRTRAFPHHFDAPPDLLPALTAAFPNLRRLELRGLGLLQLLLRPPQPPPPPPRPQKAQPPPEQPPPQPHPEQAEQPPQSQSQHPHKSLSSGVDRDHDRDLGGGLGGLGVLGSLAQLRNLALGVLDPPPRLLGQLAAALRRQLVSLELDVWFVMTPPDELRPAAAAAGRAVAALERLQELRLRLMCCVEEEEEGEGGGREEEEEGWRELRSGDEAWGGREEGEGLWAGWEEEEVEGAGCAVEGVMGGYGGSGHGGGPKGEKAGSLMAALLRPVAAAAVARGKEQQRRGERDRERGRRAVAGGGCGGGIRVMRLPGHELRAGEWMLLRRLPSLARLEVGAVAAGFGGYGTSWGGVEVVVMEEEVDGTAGAAAAGDASGARCGPS
ncbi:hypothetical protein PLESTB_000907400 [Pleodorina starrii]|uniref:Uncharacterized protein n=1 Tax=Pleodorina starrii TaxID=330485 RepID=A0A9W6BNX9_9CHLO|nr:hypothetical protein PLESTB_000907400 [Pleodorina starrii]